ncbi:hypothetical protein Taro_011431, partial [Colocasia esculenta]|nr:hypothetical protein [Colocasia esculenta]
MLITRMHSHPRLALPLELRSHLDWEKVVSTQCFKCKAERSSGVDTGSGSVDTRPGSVDTRYLPRTPSGLVWDSVSTLVQVVSTLVPFQNKNYRSR